MRQFWITAANAYGAVILNNLVSAKDIDSAMGWAKEVVPVAHWGNICITNPDGSDLPVKERWKLAFGEARAVGLDVAHAARFMQPTLQPVADLYAAEFDDADFRF